MHSRIARSTASSTGSSKSLCLVFPFGSDVRSVPGSTPGKLYVRLCYPGNLLRRHPGTGQIDHYIALALCNALNLAICEALGMAICEALGMTIRKPLGMAIRETLGMAIRETLGMTLLIGLLRSCLICLS